MKNSLFMEDNRSITNEKFEKMLNAIQNRDVISLKSVFSKKTLIEVDDLDEKIVEMFDYFQGEFVSYDDWGEPAGGGGMNDDGTGRNWKYVQATYDVVTSKGLYHFSFQDITLDTANPNNVGIYTLYIIKDEEIPDEEKGFAYLGDGNWTPGINIGKKNN